MKLNTRDKGFSLIELMVAMALGSFIIAGLVSVFISASRSYATQQALVEIQDKGRFAIKKIREDVQRAGFGVDSTENPVKLVAALGTTDCNTNLEVLEIYFNEGVGTKNTLICYFLNATGELRRNQTLVDTAAVVAEEITIINSIDQIDFFFAVDVDGGGVDIVGGDLYHDIDNFEGAAKVAEWFDVIAVRIELVVASNTDRVVDDGQTLISPFGGVNLVYSDSRLHQAYAALVSLRNRI